MSIKHINPNLGWGVISPLCWFSLNNSEEVKTVAMAFCSTEYYFNRDILAKFGIPHLPQSPDIGQNSGGGIFDISGQSL